MNNKNQKKLAYLDIIIGVIGFLIVFCILKPSTLINMVPEPGQSYMDIKEYYSSIYYIKPLLFIYSFHRVYSGLKNFFSWILKIQMQKNCSRFSYCNFFIVHSLKRTKKAATAANF